MNNRNAGLTLLEALLGLAVLAISLLALIMLQQTSLSTDTTAGISRTAQRLAENELNAHLASDNSPAGTCLTQADITTVNAPLDSNAAFTCDTLIMNCGILAAPSVRLECGPAVAAPTHELISVQVRTPKGDAMTLSGLRAKP